MKQSTDWHAYFAGEKPSTWEQPTTLNLSEPMVATDLHRYIDILQQVSKKDDFESSERAHAKIDLENIIQSQINEAKKQELFAYIRTQTFLFDTTRPCGPKHQDFFYHLLNHFPISCNQYEKEMYTEIPELKKRMQTPVEAHTKASKKDIIDTFRNNDQKHASNAIPSFLYCLATRIDWETLHAFALRVETDTWGLLGNGLNWISKIHSIYWDMPTQKGKWASRSVRSMHDYANESLANTWPAPTIKFAEQSNGKIQLRPDGKFDMYLDSGELFVKWAQRLHSTEETNPKKGIIQGTHKDEEGNEGVAWITYMSSERAMKEAKKQWLCFFKESEVDLKVETFLKLLWPTWKKQIQALEMLFWKPYSGIWSPTRKMWRLTNFTRLACSEILSDGCVRLIRWCEDYPGCIYRWWVTEDFGQIWHKKEEWYHPFIAFEEC